jgi:hypothetical protein
MKKRPPPFQGGESESAPQDARAELFLRCVLAPGEHGARGFTNLKELIAVAAAVAAHQEVKPHRKAGLPGSVVGGQATRNLLTTGSHQSHHRFLAATPFVSRHSRRRLRARNRSTPR